MWGNSTPMSGCAQKVLSCTEVGFMSQTTLNSVMTWCMHIMEPLSQDTLDDGSCWNWCHGTTGGQGCPGMLPSSLGCDACNQTKTSPTQKVGKLIPNKVPDQRWQVISVDMIGELPDSKGYNAILVVVDRLSKWIHTVPTVTSLDSAGVAQLFLEHIWCHHGLPEE